MHTHTYTHIDYYHSSSVSLSFTLICLWKQFPFVRSKCGLPGTVGELFPCDSFLWNVPSSAEERCSKCLRNYFYFQESLNNIVYSYDVLPFSFLPFPLKYQCVRLFMDFCFYLCISDLGFSTTQNVFIEELRSLLLWHEHFVLIPFFFFLCLLV